MLFLFSHDHDLTPALTLVLVCLGSSSLLIGITQDSLPVSSSTAVTMVVFRLPFLIICHVSLSLSENATESIEQRNFLSDKLCILGLGLVLIHENPVISQV